MYQKLDKVLKLVAKTGDKIIVVSENHDPYVVMSLADYDRLITGSSAVNELTEEQLLGKLNRDIAVWKSAQEVEEIPKNTDEYDLDQFKVAPENTEETEQTEEKASVDNGSVEEEDKYYIEPVE
jgi:PHD/YefM family antitoxin component YafN of YafNO toxin-antitoxin module